MLRHLQVLSNTLNAAGDGGTITLRLPCLSSNIANPGWYMVFLNNNDLPCNMAAWIQLVEPSGGDGGCVPAGPTIQAAVVAPGGGTPTPAGR